MPTIAAQLELEIRRTDGTAEPFVARVFAPVPANDDWRCDIQFEGCIKKSHRIFGVDSWQTLMLALKFVRVNIESRLHPGSRLIYLGEAVELSSLFNGLAS